MVIPIEITEEKMAEIINNHIPGNEMNISRAAKAILSKLQGE